MLCILPSFAFLTFVEMQPLSIICQLDMRAYYFSEVGFFFTKKGANFHRPL